MEYYAKAGTTLQAFELDPEDVLRFELSDGRVRTLQMLSARAKIHETSLSRSEDRPLVPEFRGRTVVRMHCMLSLDGAALELVRWVGSDRSFYEPWELGGLQLWFDAAQDLFEILSETHGSCRPRKRVRLAVQEAGRSIAPVLLHPWCPLPAGGISIQDCYDACDCWLGPYFGAEAHGGLDLNHPAGTPIWAPVGFQEHEWFDRIDAGAKNNRWRGIRAWPDGSRWIMQVHHFYELCVDTAFPVEAGTLLARGAGVSVGSLEHSHFEFAVVPAGAELSEAILLDPWILFRQMYRDRALASAQRQSLQ